MNFLVAPDSFKGGLKNTEFCNIIEEILTNNGHNVKSLPLSDGGDGCVETFTEALNGKVLEGRATDANFFLRPIKYGVCDDTAVISVSECSGLAKTMIKDPLFTTTYGLGEAVKLVKSMGKKKILIGLGGSATNDGGAGAVCALGGKFYNAENEEFTPCGGTLEKIEKIDLSEFYKNIEGLKFVALADVNNPLLGDNGCSRIFARQKGARGADIDILEANMAHFAIQTAFLGTDPSSAGMGAAGGLGYGLKAFFNAEIVSGAQYLFELIDFENEVKHADCVITGEGQFNATSTMGKVCFRVAETAKKYGKKVVVFCGEGEECEGADVIGINDKTLSLKENIASSAGLLRFAAVKYFSENINKTCRVF